MVSQRSWRAGLALLGLFSIIRLALPLKRFLMQHINKLEVDASKQCGGFRLRRFSKEQPPYRLDAARYQRFDQKNDMFCRPSWDTTLKESILVAFPAKIEQWIARNRPGWSHLDFAFFAAASTVATALGSFGGSFGSDHRGLYSLKPLSGTMASTMPFAKVPAREPMNMTPSQLSLIVKKAAKFYGASLVGIADVDERWVYAKRYSSVFTNFPETIGRHAPILFEDVEEPSEAEDGTLVIPKRMKYVIVLAFEMDKDAIETSLAPAAAAAVSNGYSRMAFTAGTVAEWIRALGYQALPCGNNTALSIPIAVDAGLGELGRNGLLITPQFGPRVRLAKVFTDMPLAPDKPITFGVEEFCEVCGKCARFCPGAAILKGRNRRTYNALNISNNPGVYKWPVDAEKCHHIWCNTGHDCAICVRVCPFDKPDRWLHRVGQRLVSMRSSAIDPFLVKLDAVLAYGHRSDPAQFWGKDSHPYHK